MSEQRRLLAWIALSELFLDTEHDERSDARMARELAATGYSIVELEQIYNEEVAPVCWRNLHVVAGIWDRFDPDWLQECIQKQVADPGWLSNISWLKRWRIQRWTADTRSDWERIKRALKKH